MLAGRVQRAADHVTGESRRGDDVGDERDGRGLTGAQAPCGDVGPVAEFLGGGKYPPVRLGGQPDVVAPVEDHRGCGLGQPRTVRHIGQSDSLAGHAPLRIRLVGRERPPRATNDDAPRAL